MTYKIDTRKIGGRHYVAASRLVAERQPPEGPLEFPRAFLEDLLDERGKLQWEMIANPDYGKVLSEERVAPDEINQVIDDRPYIAVLHPQEPTGEELEAEATQERRARVMDALADILLEAEDPGDLVRRIKEVRDAPPEA